MTLISRRSADCHSRSRFVSPFNPPNTPRPPPTPPCRIIIPPLRNCGVLKAGELHCGGLHLCCTVGLGGIPAGCDWIGLHPLGARRGNWSPEVQPSIINLATSYDCIVFSGTLVYSHIYIYINIFFFFSCQSSITCPVVQNAL